MVETTYAKPYKAQKHHVFTEAEGSLCGRYDFDPYDRHFETRRFSAFFPLCPKCKKKLDDADTIH